jgi:formiminoglutamase
MKQIKEYTPPNPKFWSGRNSEKNGYLHEKVKYTDLEKDTVAAGNRTFALLGYACDEGVRRNQGRIGAAEGPDAIRQQLGKMPNHLEDNIAFLDTGNILCENGDMEGSQLFLSSQVSRLLQNQVFPILIGGGHDIAYGHYKGLKKFIEKGKSLGIVNFDAHFDLRSNVSGNNSGTPFYQIAKDCNAASQSFNYLCLGIREDANDKMLFRTARELNVGYRQADRFSMHQFEEVKEQIDQFVEKQDHVYLTIDIDGFSSAFSPGVSAASPMGFSPDIVLESLKTIIQSEKLISMDIAEMNPNYDIDHRSAKLAASLIHFIMHKIALL